MKAATGYVYNSLPAVARSYQLFSWFSSHRLHHTRHSSHTGCSSYKLEEHNYEQLRKVSQPAFAAIVLQVAVDHKLIQVLNA